jgi:hypothetical protein
MKLLNSFLPYYSVNSYSTALQSLKEDVMATIHSNAKLAVAASSSVFSYQGSLPAADSLADLYTLASARLSCLIQQVYLVYAHPIGCIQPDVPH